MLWKAYRLIPVSYTHLLNLLANEKDGNRKADLIAAFYGTAIDGFPLQLLGLSKQLQEMAKRNNDIYAESAALSAAGQGYRLSLIHI